MRNRGTIYNLIWLDKGDNTPERYEYFTSPQAIYEKYSAAEIGVTKGTLLNVFVKLKNDEERNIIFCPPKNPNLRIVKGYLYGKEKR